MDHFQVFLKPLEVQQPFSNLKYNNLLLNTKCVPLFTNLAKTNHNQSI